MRLTEELVRLTREALSGGGDAPSASASEAAPPPPPPEAGEKASGAAAAPDVVLAIDGMRCQRNCGTTVANALSGVAGVTRAEVGLRRDGAHGLGASTAYA